jgi:hypothetical protein
MGLFGELFRRGRDHNSSAAEATPSHFVSYAAPEYCNDGFGVIKIKGPDGELVTLALDKYGRPIKKVDLDNVYFPPEVLADIQVAVNEAASGADFPTMAAVGSAIIDAVVAANKEKEASGQNRSYATFEIPGLTIGHAG